MAGKYLEFNPNLPCSKSTHTHMHIAGAELSKETEKLIVQEAKKAFKHNAAVYSEVCPESLPSMNVGAALGAGRIVTGAVRNLLVPYS